jgi:hypothetical protein
MSVRKRKWTTRRGEAREAWIVDYLDHGRRYNVETFDRKADADDRHAEVRYAKRIGSAVHAAPGIEAIEQVQAPGRAAMKKYLTDRGVANLTAPPRGKQIDYYDTVVPRLKLRVNYGGSKVWQVLHYVSTVAGPNSKKAGQRISMPTTRVIGRYPALSVEAARDKARRFLSSPTHRAEAVESNRARAASKYAEFKAQRITPQAFLYRH